MPAEELRQLLFHVEDFETDRVARLELHEYVDIAVGPEIVAEHDPKSDSLRIWCRRQKSAISSFGTRMLLLTAGIPCAGIASLDSLNVFYTTATIGHASWRRNHGFLWSPIFGMLRVHAGAEVAQAHQRLAAGVLDLHARGGRLVR